MKKIPYGKHKLFKRDIDYLNEILKSNSITQGKTVEKFSSNIANFVGAKYAVAVSSGTAALHSAVSTLDLKKGDEVITTPMTFCATANSVLYEGGEVKFADINMKNLNIDPYEIEKKITKKTKAIIAVDFRGHPAQLLEIKQIAKNYNLKLIEDASHSLGSRYFENSKTYKCGDCSHVDMATFSFHPVKHITTGEGGVITTNNKKLFHKLDLFRKHGIERLNNMFSKRRKIGKWYYDMESLGYNYRLTDFQSALGISQLKSIKSFIKRRRKIVNYYNSNFKNIEQLIIPYEEKNVDSNFHLYSLQIKNGKKKNRYNLFNYLSNNNYSPMVHYIPIHFLKYYKNRYNLKRGDFKNSELFYSRTISLPLYPTMNDADVEKVVMDIKKFLK
jgi:UDP-4-amino-4,6-dideoxy-N-acetyl-beta-L-altrosamine transaminase